MPAVAVNPVTRLALGFLIVAGCAFLWIGIPVGGLWLAGQVTDDAEVFLFIALGGIPLAMIVCGWLIWRLSGMYADLHEEDEPFFPLAEVAMTASAVTALVLMLLWFFFLAEMRLVTPP